MWSPLQLGLEVRNGCVPVVVYAPHAGRRGRPIRRGDAVNDLHTADVARELADALDAHALVNPSIDRNDADLNRVSVLASSGAPALAALGTLVERAARDDSVPLVLVVHGWNVTMPACDVGVGLTTRNGTVLGSYPTVSRGTFDGFLRRLSEELRTQGIEAPLGRRYSASGRDNATQLFSGRHLEHEHAGVRALSARARAGGIDAVQLELAIPLRWPGAYRARFLGTLISAVRHEIEQRSRVARRMQARPVPRDEWMLPAAVPRSAAPAARGRETRRMLPLGWSLQAILDDGSGLFAGAEPSGEHDAAGRLCLVRADGRMLLFVGEDEWSGDAHELRVGGLTLNATSPRTRAQGHDEGSETRASLMPASLTGVTEGMHRRSLERGTLLRLSYDGPMVVYPSHDAFCDLEIGLAGSNLVAGAADLVFEAEDGGFGRLRGTVSYGSEHLGVDVVAVCERGSRRSGSVQTASRVFVTHGPVAPVALSSRADDCAEAAHTQQADEADRTNARDATARSEARRRSRGRDEQRCVCRTNADGEVAAIECVLADGRSLDARVLTRVPVYRALGKHAIVKVTFGTAELPGDSTDELSLALFEHVELISQR